MPETDYKCLDKAGELAEVILTNPKKPVGDIVYRQLCGSVPRKSVDEILEEMGPEFKEAMEIYGQLKAEYGGLFHDWRPPEKTKPRYETIRSAPKMVFEETKEAKKTRAKEKKSCFKKAKSVSSCIRNLTKGKQQDEYTINMASSLCLCGEAVIRKAKKVKQPVAAQASSYWIR